MIVDAKGYIVTNRHVVEKADRIRVAGLQDDPPGVQHDAKVIGEDSETDLAVIKIDMDRPVAFGEAGQSGAAWRSATGFSLSAARLGKWAP